MWVDFDYVNPEIGDLLQNFEQGRITEEDTYKSLKFIPLSGGLKISNRLVRNVPILKPEETEAHRKVKLKFLQELLQRGYIKNLSVNADDTVSFAFKDEAIMHLMKIQGAVFELVVYYLMWGSGQFDDVETGVKIAWDTEDTLPEQMLMEATGASKTFGYSVYIKARTELFQRMEFRGGQSVKNEIDIIALKGMNAIMVSCKTSDSGNIQWIYEIKAVSEHFQSTGVLALVTDYTNKSKTAFMERAKQMGVRLWGTETYLGEGKIMQGHCENDQDGVLLLNKAAKEKLNEEGVYELFTSTVRWFYQMENREYILPVIQRILTELLKKYAP